MSCNEETTNQNGEDLDVHHFCRAGDWLAMRLFHNLSDPGRQSAVQVLNLRIQGDATDNGGHGRVLHASEDHALDEFKSAGKTQ